MFRRKRAATAIGVAAVCATGGVIAGIAGSAAAPSKSSSSSGATGAAATKPMPGRWAGRRGLRHELGGQPVHAELVVPNAAGTGFDNVTMDNGKFKSLSGDQLTITEGTDKATYKTVTLTIPSNARVRRNWQKANLSDLRDGDYVHVLVGPRGTFVGANDAQHRFPRFARGFRRYHGPGGPPMGGPPPGGPPGPDGPPPGMP